jgi:hypothetical protein
MQAVVEPALLVSDDAQPEHPLRTGEPGPRIGCPELW